MRRLAKFNLPNVHFVTTNVFRRHPIFTDGRYAGIIFQALHAYKLMHGAKVYGYVLMPDHLHLVLHLPEGREISNFMREFKKLAARNILVLLKTEGKVTKFARPEKGKKNYNLRFWQEGFFDFNVYSERKFQEKLNYMHNDPVKYGFVLGPEEYPYSSYGYYAFGCKGCLEIDDMG